MRAIAVAGTRSGVPPPRDPGLQAERTALAWNRTALAILANSLLVLRSGLANGRSAITVLALVLFLASGALYLFGVWRRRQLLDGCGDMAPPALAPALTALVTLGACAAGMASILR